MSDYGRIDSYKNAIEKKRPLEGEMLRQLRDYYRIGLTWSSNALEGNTLTISETKVVLEDGLTIGGKPLKDLYETVGHAKAYDYMFSLIFNRDINAEDIKKIHKLFYNEIDEKNAGVFREHDIIVTGTQYVFPSPHELEREMSSLDKWIDTEREKYHPIDFASMLHLKFVTIHPFIDGNGRVARLIMNLALLQDGYMPIAIPPICRSEYLSSIRTYQNNGESKPFFDFIAERVLEGEKEIMKLFHIPLPDIDLDIEI